jgi:hypothetical protein
MADNKQLPGAKTATNADTANADMQASIAATTTVGAYYYYRKAGATSTVVTARIAGTFVGTIVVQIADPSEATSTNTNWVTIDGGSFTAPTSKLISLAGDCNLRIYSTAWTSGSALTSLSG